MRGRREKVFGPGRAVPLDRNAKARIAAYATRLERPEQAAAPAQGPDHPRLPGGPGGAAVGLPQQPAPVSASRATRRSPPRRSAAAARSPRP